MQTRHLWGDKLILTSSFSRSSLSPDKISGKNSEQRVPLSLVVWVKIHSESYRNSRHELNIQLYFTM